MISADWQLRQIILKCHSFFPPNSRSTIENTRNFNSGCVEYDVSKNIVQIDKKIRATWGWVGEFEMCSSILLSFAMKLLMRNSDIYIFAPKTFWTWWSRKGVAKENWIPEKFICIFITCRSTPDGHRFCFSSFRRFVFQRTVWIRTNHGYELRGGRCYLLVYGQ